MDHNTSVHPTEVASSIPARVELVYENEIVIYREPPPPYSPEPPNSEVTVQIAPPVHQPPLKNDSMLYTCHICRETVHTRVVYVNTRKTHMLAGFIFGFTFWCMLCCFAVIPYIIPVFKTAEHYCPNCKAFLGAYK